MVQLNTTYDSKLKGKVFVLKGEEAYARTTDTVAELISDFEDCNTHFSYTRVGLQIRVLRAIGDGLITIYIDGNEQEPIPYNPSKMNQLIDSDFNAKGIYWSNDSLIIGNPSNSDTGYHVDYDIEHSIKVVYSSTDKLCLGSESETILFEHERPDTLVSSLSFGSTPTYVDSVYPTGVATITGTIELECEYDVEEEQRNVYLIIEDLGIRELVEVYPNTPTSFTLTGVSEGMQTIKALFDGDYEILDCMKLHDISVGCKVGVFSSSPDPIINDESTYYKVTVRDYFGNLVEGTVSPVYCPSIVEEIHAPLSIGLSKSEYSQMIGQNPNIDSNVIDMTTLFTKSETAKYLNVPIGSEDAYGLKYYDNVNVAVSYDDIVGKGRLTPITLSFTSNGSPVPNLVCGVEINGSSRTVIANQKGIATFNYTGTGAGDVTLSTSRPVSSETIIDYDKYWSRDPNIEVDYNYFDVVGITLKKSALVYDLVCGDVSQPSIGFSLPDSPKYQMQLDIYAIMSAQTLEVGVRGNGATVTVYPNTTLTITKEYVQSENRTYYTLSNGTTSESVHFTGNLQYIKLAVWGDVGQGFTFKRLKGRIIE